VSGLSTTLYPLRKTVSEEAVFYARQETSGKTNRLWEQAELVK
jgi:hypothetical protein